MGIGIRDLLEENNGHHALQYIAFAGTISIFVLLSNLLGVFPFFASPTGNVSVPLSCAIFTFLYFNWQGIRHHGIGGYLKHFAGPVWWLSPLIFPVEIISTTARLLSLTVRLWANIFASDMIYGIFLSLLAGPAVWGWSKTPVLGVILGVFPAVLPLAFIGLHIFVSIIQAYVFTILPSVYIGMATAEEH
jgi:F-type H+-transporting ATPase subunit a